LSIYLKVQIRHSHMPEFCNSDAGFLGIMGGEVDTRARALSRSPNIPVLILIGLSSVAADPERALESSSQFHSMSILSKAVHPPMFRVVVLLAYRRARPPRRPAWVLALFSLISYLRLDNDRSPLPGEAS